MKAAAAKIDITPAKNVWMEGMVREHPSEGVHDPLFARALVLADDKDISKSCVLVSADVCIIAERDADIIRETVSKKCDIPQDAIIIATTHTHSGPATIGYFSPNEPEYIKKLIEKIIRIIEQALLNLKPALVGCGCGTEITINHYRRLLADDGSVIMNWEEFPAERLLKPLGEPDTQVGVLKVVEARDPENIISVLFNFPCHPNVFSGDNYLISADFPGFAAKLLEEEFNCPAIFINGAEGTMDIDGLRDRDWEGVVRTGTALAKAVSQTTKQIECFSSDPPELLSVKYNIPKRKITADELKWAENVLAVTKNESFEVMRDGVGDDFKAELYKKLYESKQTELEVEQICFTIANAAFITFPGEVFTEIGMEIKEKSPFEQTYFLGMINGCVGYIPTKKAISEGGYAVDTRNFDAETEDILIKNSINLLNKLKKV